ncbi:MULTISPECIES: FIVAR domain-containing protein [Gardnerella]|uniref:Peptidase n=2 Tax=Bacillati TaxID=1783272 RepID=A0AAP8ITT6_GARVA|nr:FIVAR domain-containing protein [Gardnerella sp. 30-4]PKZ60091.1 peptidase [Gardnerella vaginalis]
MANSNSGRHARKVTLDAAVSNAIAKAVDARKVAAFTVGAAGVLAGAAFAFGATPAMAAENGAAAGAASVPVEAGKKPGVEAENKDAAKSDKAKEEVKKNQTDVNKDSEQKSEEKKQPEEKPGKTNLEKKLANKTKTSTQSVVKVDGEAGVTETEQKTASVESVDNKATDSTAATDKTANSTPTANSARKRSKRATVEDKQLDDTKPENQDRASNDTANQDLNKITPAAQADGSTKIEINDNNADSVPNAYAWGSSDNTYSVNGEKHTVTFHFAAPKDGSKITSIAIFPARTNGFNNAKSERGIDFYSKDPNKHQAYSGEYIFTANSDGSATLTMSTLFRDGNLNGGAEKYTASRSIFVYVTKDGSNKETIAYKTNVFRAVTLVPPKTSGSVVLKYNQPLTAEKVQAAIIEAGNINTERSDKKSVNDQLSGAFTQNINVKADGAYDKTTFNAINAKKAGDDNTYVVGAKTLNTYMVTDLGFKSQAIPLTVARYDDRIDKPIVEDPTNLSAEVKEEIKTKLAKINGVTADKISFDGDNAVIHFDGVDEKDAPKIALRDLVLKKFTEDQIKVPAESTATVIYNPLAYSDAEIKSIKKAIYEANKDNTELGLSATDYEKQITLSYLTGNLTAAGHANQGISNGQAENTITVKIKTDKAVAEFKSDVKAGKLTRLADIRKDYDVSWKNNKIAGRDTDEGLSWSEDHKTIIYRYDPTKAEGFDTNKILNLLKATPKDGNAGLRELTGGEALAHEGDKENAQKSHVGYVIDKNGQPTTELSLGNMSGAYWQYSQNVSNSGENLGDSESNAGSYSWDEEAKPVVVAAKGNKVYKARLFVLPYGLTMYRNIYIENGKNPGNTPKAINVIFVPQTNHKTSDLKKSVEDHKTTHVEGKEVPTDSAYYNASDKVKSDYDDALKVAKQTLEKVGNTADADLTEALKAEVDNATIKLEKARKALDGDATKKEELKKSIDENGKAAEGQQAATGTQATNQFKNVSDPDFKKSDGSADTDRNEAAKKAKTAYDEALQAAEAARDNNNATQKDVDAAKAKLDTARKELDKYSTNKDELNNAIAQHGKVKTGDTSKQGEEKLKTADPAYQNATDLERKAYDEAVKKANDLSADPTASQKEVNAAITALEAAKKALDAKATNKAKLAAAVQQTFDNPDPDNANGKKSTFYKNAKAKSESTDTGVTEAQKTAAKKAYEDYDKALAKAKQVLASKDATQKQVEEAEQALTSAEDALHKDYATDANDLTKALADNIDGYLKPAYFNAFDKAQAGDQKAKQAFKEYNEAYQKAKELKRKFAETETSKQPTAEEITAAKEALEKARQVIDTYATDTSKLSAAFWNDLAIQNSPAYKNAKALAEKQNPTEEEKTQVEAAKKIKQAYDDAVAKLHKAFENKLDKDKGTDGTDIPVTNIPDAKGDLNDKDYLKNIQAHENGEPLDRDVTKILKAMNDASAQLNQFATKTDKLQESINKDSDTRQTPGYKNASVHNYLSADGNADSAKNTAARKAANEYGEALNKAKDLLKKSSATQEEVDAALKTLDEKRNALDMYNTDTAKLETSVKAHGSTDGAAPTEGTQTSDAYRNASDPHFLTAEGKPDTKKNDEAKKAKKAYDKALVEAQELLKKHDDKDTPQDAKPTQKDINAALKALDEARTKLDTYKTDTTKLEAEANKSTAEHAPVTENDFEDTPEFKNADAKKKDGADGKKVDNDDVKAYKDALAKARKLAQDNTSNTLSDHPTQKQIDDALEALKQAKQAITDGYKTNVDKLKQAKEYAEDVFKKTPEYKNAEAIKADANNAKHDQAGKDLGDATKQTGFEGQIAKIAEKLKDTSKLTQREVDALVKQLNIAQKKIADSYKTNVDKLNNEVGDKDQDGKPVTPKFEESIPYKNALEKKNAGDADATAKLEAYNEKLKAAQELINKVNNPDPNVEADKQPTQKEVDDALKALQDAKKAIDDSFGTKIDDLKTEAAKSTADTTDPTAKPTAGSFESTTEYQNALAKKTDDGKDNADVTAYKEALKKARTLLEKFGDDGKPKPGAKDVPTQQEVDVALNNLKEIKDKITKNYVTSPHDLQEEVDKSKDGKDDTSTDVFENTPEFKNATAKGDEAAKKALDAYTEKLKAARKLLDAFDRTTGKPKGKLPDGMDKAPTQQELDAALKDLQDAKKKITDGYKTNKSDLNTEAGKDSDFTKTPEYQNAQAKGDDASKQALEDYKKALEDANKVLGDKNATQAQVDDALKKLQDAKSKLSDGYKTDKTDLTAEAGKDSDFTKTPEYQNAQAKGDNASKQALDAYKKALEDANKVLDDKNATQAQVDEALKKLQNAKKKLTDSNKTDKSKLQTEADADAKFRDSVFFMIGMTEDIDAYNKALAEANSVLADPNATQAQVDEALRKLQAAKDKINHPFGIDSGVGSGSGSGVGSGSAAGFETTDSQSASVDKTALRVEVNNSEADSSAASKANTAAARTYVSALAEAKRVLADKNATQAQVDAALRKLKNAKAAWRNASGASGNASGLAKTGAATGLFASLAAVFSGLGVAGIASRRRKHSNE